MATPLSQVCEGAEEEGKERDRDAASQAFGSDDRHKLLSLVYEYFLGLGLKRLKDVSTPLPTRTC